MLDGIASWIDSLRQGAITMIIIVAAIITIPAKIKVIVLKTQICKKGSLPTRRNNHRKTNNIEQARATETIRTVARSTLLPDHEDSYYVMGIGIRSAADTSAIPRFRNYYKIT